MDDNKNTQTNTAQSSDEALQSFLNREQNDEKKPEKPSGSKLNKRVIIIIIAVLVVAALVVLLIVLRSQPKKMNENETTAVADVSLDVDSKGEHIVKIALDENGNIAENGSGKLLNYVPSDISRIDVENSSGSFAVLSSTPEGEATVYKIEGFEDYPMQDGIADEIASSAAAAAFTKIVSADGNLADYGLDKPRAVVKLKFHDDTSAVIRVGDEAPGKAGTYIAFADSSAVFLATTDSVEPFMYSVNKFISLAVTDSAEESDNNTFTSLTVSGARYDDPITIVPNTDEAIESAYIVTEPRRMYANAIESYDIAGSVRGLYAEEVVCVNPSKDQLSSYGLSEPYATVKASYPDTEITLSASQADDNGSAYLYSPNKDIIYSIQLSAISWAKTSVEALIPEYILTAKLDKISKIDFTAGDDKYSFDVSTSTELQDDEEGNTQDVTVTRAKYDGKELDSDYFHIFFQNLNGIKNTGDNGSGGSEVMSFTYTYNTDRAADTVTAYSTGSAHYAIALNGTVIGSASKSYIDSLIDNPSLLIKGDPVPNL